MPRLKQGGNRKMREHPCPKCGTKFLIIQPHKNTLCYDCDMAKRRIEGRDSPHYMSEHQNFADDDNLYI